MTVAVISAYTMPYLIQKKKKKNNQLMKMATDKNDSFTADTHTYSAASVPDHQHTYSHRFNL